MQEGSEKISVYKLQSRTTSALEAFNGQLGKKIITEGNFYKFVELIQEVEFEKGREFKLLIESGGAVVRDKKRKVSLHRISCDQINATESIPYIMNLFNLFSYFFVYRIAKEMLI